MKTVRSVLTATINNLRLTHAKAAVQMDLYPKMVFARCLVIPRVLTIASRLLILTSKQLE